MTGARPTKPPTTGGLGHSQLAATPVRRGITSHRPRWTAVLCCHALGREVLLRRCSAGSAVQFVEGVDGLHDGGGVRAEVAGAAVVNQLGEGS
jgi:hypothetical protein